MGPTAEDDCEHVEPGTDFFSGTDLVADGWTRAARDADVMVGERSSDAVASASSPFFPRAVGFLRFAFALTGSSLITGSLASRGLLLADGCLDDPPSPAGSSTLVFVPAARGGGGGRAVPFALVGAAPAEVVAESISASAFPIAACLRRAASLFLTVAVTSPDTLHVTLSLKQERHASPTNVQVLYLRFVQRAHW